MKRKILVVDDSSIIHKSVMQSLIDFDYEILEAPNGGKGLELAKDNPDLSLIISDINMPEMNGIEMIEALGVDQQTSSIPVMVLSSEGGSELIAKAKTLGVKGWLVKPFNSAQLQEIVKKLLGE